MTHQQCEELVPSLSQHAPRRLQEGVKVLEVLLDSTDFLQALDQATSLLQASSKPHGGASARVDWPM